MIINERHFKKGGDKMTAKIKDEFLETTVKGAAILRLSGNDEYGREKFNIQYVELPNWPLRILFKHQNLNLVRIKYQEMLKYLGDGSPEEIQKFKGRYFI